ncbi:MAG: putative exporter of the RND superfamily [Candidatus Methanohalarchaeum thermophilum]|uniref:Exporter of the RND superfamily n=1 Tax=Methanohalarchaeum thermophilum TaxID=1903181 RepID=A0A1Q6DX33_METT1|nr:MAG: putative exporter of the RND superfamily [Candidatus Methanohalarchaeum thermophilum]
MTMFSKKISIDPDELTDPLNHQIIEHSKKVLLVFFVVTLILAAGLPKIGIDAGTERFFESVPEHDTQQYINNKFGQSFKIDKSTTEIIYSSDNIFSKRSILKLLELQKEVQQDPSLRVDKVTGVASGVARMIDPLATDISDQIQVIKSSTNLEVLKAGQELIETRSETQRILSKDLNPNQPRASDTMLIISHSIEEDSTDLERIQKKIRDITSTMDGEFRVYGSALKNAKFDVAIFESLSLVVPSVTILVFVFLVIAYRDPIDLLLGLLSLILALIWTFGFMGYFGIPFSLVMIAVPVLVLGVGIDFGIHAINRYREERTSNKPITKSMWISNSQLLIAFFIVTVTNIIGFSSNLTADLEPIREFGAVVSIGMFFTFLLFGIFLPTLKFHIDKLRKKYNIPQFSLTPLGGKGSILGKILRFSEKLANSRPLILITIILIITAGAFYSATNVKSEFEDEDFLPYDDLPWQIEIIPDRFAPQEYEITATANYIRDSFETTQSEIVTIYVEGNLKKDHSLESIYRRGQDPPTSFVTKNGRTVSQSIIDIMHEYAQQDPEFAELLDKNDLSGNGVPDRNLKTIYQELLHSTYRNQALEYITEDMRSMRIDYQVKADKTDKEVTVDAKSFTERFRFDSTATGDIIVFRALTEALTASAIKSFLVAFFLTAIFLSITFGLLEGYWSLGLINMAPITVALILLVGSMPILGIAFNALTATILAITVGLGVAYSVHITHRFIDEYKKQEKVHESLLITLGGTGGGVTASILTTAGSALCTTLAASPILAQFGLLTALSTFYSYLAAITVLPLTLHAWAKC